MSAKITSTPDIMGGAWCIAGTRIPASVVKSFHKTGHSHEQIQREYPTLTIAQIKAAIEFVEPPMTTPAIKDLVERLRRYAAHNLGSVSVGLVSEAATALESQAARIAEMEDERLLPMTHAKAEPARISAARLSAFEEAAKEVERWAYGMFTGWTKEGREQFGVEDGWIDMDEAERAACESVLTIAASVRTLAAETPAVAPSAIQSTQDTAEAGEAAHGASTGQETAIRAQTREGK